jgi:Domain of unknown function (DUF4276)
VNLGLVVEDTRDGNAYEELIRKIRQDIQNIHAMPCHGPVATKLGGWLKYFQWSSPYPMDKVLVIRNSDRRDPDAAETELRLKYEHLHLNPGFPVHFHATKTELESWLLVDENAMNEVSRQRGKRGRIGPINFDPESCQDAKERFQKRLLEVDLPADPAVYREVAAASEIRAIAARCPLFASFQDKVRHC